MNDSQSCLILAVVLKCFILSVNFLLEDMITAPPPQVIVLLPLKLITPASLKFQGVYFCK